MSAPHDPRANPHETHPDSPTGHGGHKGHGWTMIACCAPMLIIAIALFATGVAGIGFLVVAVVCTVMMAAMMGGMSHGDDNRT
ncbi:hypothetical protein [Pseudonocardia hydrocarbonoxydans]|uniref:hypothetical protein n=1 Tax=Pseudonocardia hydrocarbonoxydans TaxID=76726 RepID=UPI0031D72C49